MINLMRLHFLAIKGVLVVCTLIKFTHSSSESPEFLRRSTYITHNVSSEHIWIDYGMPFQFQLSVYGVDTDTYSSSDERKVMKQNHHHPPLTTLRPTRSTIETER